MTKCPCQHCTAETGRSQACHCTCYDYLMYKAEREDVMKRRRDEHTLRNHCGSIKANAVKKTIGRKKLRHGLWV